MCLQYPGQEKICTKKTFTNNITTRTIIIPNPGKEQSCGVDLMNADLDQDSSQPSSDESS